MVQLIHRYAGQVDFSSESTKQTLATQLREIVKVEIGKVFQTLDADTFDFSAYAFDQPQKTRLNEFAGLYLFLNVKEKKIYLGSTKNFAHRRAQYQSHLRHPKTFSRSLRAAFLTTSKELFYFVPLVGFSTTNFSKNWKSQLEHFFDVQVEFPLLTDYLTGPFANRFYNVQKQSEFQPGNPYGRLAALGKRARPVAIGNECAWESISAAAKALNLDRSVIRKKIQNHLMRNLTAEEYKNFSGRKMQMAEAATFSKNDPDACQHYLTLIKYGR